MTIELMEIRPFRSVTRLVGASLPSRRRWALLDGAEVLAVGRGNVRKGLLGKEIPFRLLSEDGVSGYVVQSGADGVSVGADGSVQMVSDSATTERVALRLPCWGTQHLFTRLSLRLSATSVSPSAGSFSYQSTRVGIVHYTEGTSEAGYAESLLAWNGSTWAASIHITDGAHDDVATGSGLALSSVAELGFILRPSSLGSPNYPHFQANITDVWASPRVRSAGKLGQYSGFDWSTDPDQGGFFELYVARAGGTSVSATLSSLVVDMYPGTEPS